MVHCESPGTHFRRERTVELPHFTRIGIDGEEKKRSFILSEREVNRIPLSCLPWPSMNSPANGISDRDAEVTLSKGGFLVEAQEDKSENAE